MSFYTDWFLAEEKDAEAVASIATTEEHSFDDWPHLLLRNVGEIDLAALWGILRGESDCLDTTVQMLFHDTDEVFVCRVEPKFVEALAGIKAATINRLASEWKKCESLSDWNVGDIESVLGELTRFAQLAKREGKPVLQLSVL